MMFSVPLSVIITSLSRTTSTPLPNVKVAPAFTVNEPVRM